MIKVVFAELSVFDLLGKNLENLIYLAAKVCEPIVDIGNERIKAVQKFREDQKRELNEEFSKCVMGSKDENVVYGKPEIIRRKKKAD